MVSTTLERNIQERNREARDLELSTKLRRNGPTPFMKFVEMCPGPHPLSETTLRSDDGLEYVIIRYFKNKQICGHVGPESHQPGAKQTWLSAWFRRLHPAKAAGVIEPQIKKMLDKRQAKRQQKLANAS